MRRIGTAVVLGLGLGGGLGGGMSCTTSVFQCEADGECNDGSMAGLCQPDGYCSFPTDDCGSGQRYGDHAPPELAGQCVAAAGTDTDGSSGSSGSDGPGPGPGPGPTTIETLDGTSSGSTSTPVDPDTSDDSTGGPTLEDGLLLWFDFEDGFAADGQVTDRSGNERHGICDFSCPEPIDGPVGQAGGFEGEVVIVPFDPGLTTPSALSVAVWINAWELAPAMAIAEKPYAASPSNPNWNSWELRLEEKLQFFAIANVREQSVTVTEYDSNADWTHLAGVYDGTTVTLYVNGELLDQAPASTPGFDEQDVLVGAGASFGEIDDHFIGGIDELRLYDRALSTDEVAMLASGG